MGTNKIACVTLRRLSSMSMIGTALVLLASFARRTLIAVLLLFLTFNAKELAAETGTQWRIEEPIVVFVIAAGYRSMRSGEYADVGQLLGERCSNLRTCDITASNEFLGGDPAPFEPKVLVVLYQCLRASSQSVTQTYSPLTEATAGRKIQLFEGNTYRLACGPDAIDSPLANDSLQGSTLDSNRPRQRQVGQSVPQHSSTTDLEVEFQQATSCKNIWGDRHLGPYRERSGIKVQYFQDTFLAFGDCIMELGVKVTNDTNKDIRFELTGCSWNGDRASGRQLDRVAAGDVDRFMALSLKNDSLYGSLQCEWEWFPIPEKEERDNVSDRATKPSSNSQEDATAGDMTSTQRSSAGRDRSAADTTGTSSRPTTRLKTECNCYGDHWYNIRSADPNSWYSGCTSDRIEDEVCIKIVRGNELVDSCKEPVNDFCHYP